MPDNDPFYEGMTPQGQLKKQIIRIWPSIHGLITYFVFTFIDSLKAMWRIAKQSIWGNW